MEVDKYAGDQGFSPSKPVSIQSGIFPITIWNSVMYADLPDGRQELLKNEDTWYKMLGDFRSRIRFNLESIRRVVVSKAFYTFHDADGDLYVRYFYWNDSQWNRNYNWLDNDWNDNNPAALLATLFISPPLIYRRSLAL